MLTSTSARSCFRPPMAAILILGCLTTTVYAAVTCLGPQRTITCHVDPCACCRPTSTNQPADTNPARSSQARIELTDGTVVTGRLVEDYLTVETAHGMRRVPLDDVAACHAEMGAVAPGNVALAARGATVSGVFGQNSGPALIDGNSTDYDRNTGLARSAGLNNSWVVTLPKTYLLNEIRLLLWDGDGRFYRYRVEASADGQTYHTVADRSRDEWRSWQTLVFQPQPVRHIRLSGLYCSAPNDFGMHVVELEAYCKLPEAAGADLTGDRGHSVGQPAKSTRSRRSAPFLFSGTGRRRSVLRGIIRPRAN